MTTLTEFFAPPTFGDQLRDDLTEIIVNRNNANPRTHQHAPGPSQIAHPCPRKLAYTLMHTGRCNPAYDPLPSIIGTATHTWLDTAAHHANQRLGRQRWYPEIRVNITPGLAGTCDLYDADTETVIDWKVPGKTRFDAYRRHMSEVYRTQVHLYGKGVTNKGMPVKKVAICLLPRGGSLASSHLWVEDYNPQIADQAITRLHTVTAMCNDFDIDEHPDRYQWFAASGPDCVFCPHWSPHPTDPTQCPGVDT